MTFPNPLRLSLSKAPLGKRYASVLRQAQRERDLCKDHNR